MQNQDNGTSKRRTLGEVLFGKKEEAPECGCQSQRVSSSCCSSCDTDISASVEEIYINNTENESCGCSSVQQTCGCSSNLKNNDSCDCK